jgi:hypothetical protein
MLIRKTTTVVETVEMVVAAPVPMPRTVTAPRKPAPALDSKPAAPAKGHIVRCHDNYADRDGGRLPLDLWKVAAVSVAKERLLIVGVRGTAAEGREAWVFFSEVEYVRG